MEVVAPQALTAVGIYTRAANPFTLSFVVYDETTGTMLRDTAPQTFPAAAGHTLTRSADFAPLTLLPGHTYRIGAYAAVGQVFAATQSTAPVTQGVTTSAPEVITYTPKPPLSPYPVGGWPGFRQSLALFDDSPKADLRITKTDGVTTAVAGGSVTYTVTAHNMGPSAAPGATVTDTLPAVLTGTWTCVGAGGGTCTAAGSGSINDTVNLPAGGSVTYTVSATVAPSATGSLVNTATVTPPATVVDLQTADNSATDTDTLTSSADLAITKTDGVTTAVVGGRLTYTITASNAGPSDAMGATVVDTLPAALSGATWSCVGVGGATCTASGSGNLNDTVNLSAGSSVTYTLTANVTAAAAGTLSNTATVSPPAGVTDPNRTNNSATDTNTVVPGGDLALTLTGTTGPVLPGAAVSYTLIASNPGPSAVTGVALTSSLPSQLQGISWTCAPTGGATCTPSGNGAVSDTVNLPAGSAATYTLTGTVTPAAVAGNATISASLAPPAGFVDPNPVNNTVTAVTAVAAAVPSQSTWVLALMSALTAVGAAGALRQRRARQRG